MPDAVSSSAPDPSVFTRIIAGELPGRFVWRDPEVVAFTTIAPLRPGHTLVVPVEQIDHWIDVPAALWRRMAEVQLHVGRSLMSVFRPARVGTIIAGMEVPHCHVHLVPIRTEADLDFARADHSADPGALDDAAERIRTALRAEGHDEAAG